jgi:hypothetical protein
MTVPTQSVCNEFASFAFYPLPIVNERLFTVMNKKVKRKEPQRTQMAPEREATARVVTTTTLAPRLSLPVTTGSAKRDLDLCA